MSLGKLRGLRDYGPGESINDVLSSSIMLSWANMEQDCFDLGLVCYSHNLHSKSL